MVVLPSTILVSYNDVVPEKATDRSGSLYLEVSLFCFIYEISLDIVPECKSEHHFYSYLVSAESRRGCPIPWNWR